MALGLLKDGIAGHLHQQKSMLGVELAPNFKAFSDVVQSVLFWKQNIANMINSDVGKSAKTLDYTIYRNTDRTVSFLVILMLPFNHRLS